MLSKRIHALNLKIMQIIFNFWIYLLSICLTISLMEVKWKSKTPSSCWTENLTQIASYKKSIQGCWIKVIYSITSGAIYGLFLGVLMWRHKIKKVYNTVEHNLTYGWQMDFSCNLRWTSLFSNYVFISIYKIFTSAYNSSPLFLCLEENISYYRDGWFNVLEICWSREPMKEHIINVHCIPVVV